MKWITTLTATLMLSAAHATHDPKTPIPADSTSPFDFRRKPTSDYPPYTAVFEAKTYGELRGRLEEFFKAWEKDRKPLDDFASINMYFHCKQALIRTCYLLGDTSSADELLMEMDLSSRRWEQQNRDVIEKGKIHGLGKEIQAIHKKLGLEDPFPGALPDRVEALYPPLVEIEGEIGE